MASETVHPIDWSHPPPSWAVPPEFNVLHSVNASYKSQDLLEQPGIEHADGRWQSHSTGIPDQRTACAATQCCPNWTISRWRCVLNSIQGK